MVAATRTADIGMKRGRALAALQQARQLDIIAEGPPILSESADDLLAASKALDQNDRAATILRGHASEELVKVLYWWTSYGVRRNCAASECSQRVVSQLSLLIPQHSLMILAATRPKHGDACQISS